MSRCNHGVLDGEDGQCFECFPQPADEKIARGLEQASEGKFVKSPRSENDSQWVDDPSTKQPADELPAITRAELRRRCERLERELSLAKQDRDSWKQSHRIAQDAGAREIDRLTKMTENLAGALEEVRSQMCWDLDRDESSMGMADLHTDVTETLTAWNDFKKARGLTE